MLSDACFFAEKDTSMTSYYERSIALNRCFTQGVDFHIGETNIDVCFFPFSSVTQSVASDSLPTDNSIKENFSFEYPLFYPSGKAKQEKAILLLHGLNERSWNKYLSWAEFLCSHTGKPVILFPIAFHMNRSPLSWSNPRNLIHLLNFRRERYKEDRSISFANVALSDRISQNPERFYLSGRQTWADLTALFGEIKSGMHPLFKEGAQIDIFAYSIGAFLSQVALMANPKGLYGDTRLFMFCGGSIFRSMCGVSRSIMDRAAFDRLQEFYIHHFGCETVNRWSRDDAFNAFFRMIIPERKQREREELFSHMSNRINGIALANDLVIPYHGVEQAMGSEHTKNTIQLLDLPYPYTHENPFPFNLKDMTSVNAAFKTIFSRAVEFLT